MTTMANKLKSTAGSLALIVGLTAPLAAWAQEVTLRSTDGTINVTGELVGLDDGAYLIRTPLGELSIAASRVVCEGDACPELETNEADVTIVGSEAMGLRMMPLLVAGYAASLDAESEIVNNSRVEAVATLISESGFGEEIGSYAFSSFGDDAAFGALLNQEAALGMSSRRILVEEARALRADGSESMVGHSQERIVAVDSVVVVTHADNPVEILTYDQLRGIFSGEILNWSELGGDDHPINLANYEEESTNYDFFMGYLYGDDIPTVLPRAIASDDQAMSNLVFQDPYAIGYLGYAFRRGAKPVNLINECGIPMNADAFSAKTEEYSLSRRMYLYNRGDTLNDQARAFLDFATSEEADDVILKSGFIDLSIKRRSQGEGDPRRAALVEAVSSGTAGFEGTVMEEMIAKMEKNDRLSTTFYFRLGSSNVDERGQTDMERLIRYLSSEPAGTTVTFVGFTDNIGAFDPSRQLSADRATQIADDVAQMAGSSLPGITFETAGFGPIAPNACNADERGRAINRRVEVWITNESNT